jgi:hypothetical protein
MFLKIGDDMTVQQNKSFSPFHSMATAMAFGTSLIALTMFSACNSHSTTTTTTTLSSGITPPTGTPTPEPTICPAWGCGKPPIIISSGGYDPTPMPTPTAIGPAKPVCGIETTCVEDSFGEGDTKDVDLQRADLQDQNMNDRAATIAQQFGMNFDSAHQLAVLADRVQTLTDAGTVSPDAEQAVIQSALSIAGLSQDEVTTAITQSLQGDESGVNALMDKAATNLGMSSTATLRDQLLPALGISN